MEVSPKSHTTCRLPCPPQSHDVGFIIMTSFGDALEALPAAAPEAEAEAGWYRSVILNAAASLAQRWVYGLPSRHAAVGVAGAVAGCWQGFKPVLTLA